MTKKTTQPSAPTTLVIDEKALTIIENRVTPLIRQAENLTITTQQEQTNAGELLSQLNREADAFEKLKETLTKPMNAALKAARMLFKPKETKLEIAIGIVRIAMGQYQLASEQAAREKEQRLADRVSRGTMKEETAVRKMDELERPDAAVETDSGVVKFRKDFKLKITDRLEVFGDICKFQLIDLMELDESAILKYLKAGNKIEGATLEEVRISVNHR